MMNLVNATPTQLRKAADIQEQILELQDELNQLLGAPAQVPALAAETATTEAPKRRKVSAAGKARMRAAQIARWAKIKGTAPEAEPEEQPKRKMSAAGLANIRAGVAKRMAAQGKAVQKPKRKMTAAWRRALERAWAARRAKGKAAKDDVPF
jgi:hypothetical protein